MNIDFILINKIFKTILFIFYKIFLFDKYYNLCIMKNVNGMKNLLTQNFSKKVGIL